MAKRVKKNQVSSISRITGSFRNLNYFEFSILVLIFLPALTQIYSFLFSIDFLYGLLGSFITELLIIAGFYFWRL
jgi:hypothetical protein